MLTAQIAPPRGDSHRHSALALGVNRMNAAMLPPLALTPEDKHALRVLARDLEREVVQVYEEFLFVHARQVDTVRWKKLRAKEDLTVYGERDVNMRSINRLQPFFPSGRPPAEAKLGPQGSLAAQSRVPLKMVSGTVAGSLDDAMYGGTVHDTPSLRMRNEYQREVMTDNAVLSVIDEATEEDPFRFLGIVWYLKTLAIPGVSDRDILLLSHIHYSTLSTGERIGVHLYHSIEHPSIPVPTSSGVLRMNVSLVILFRQISERSVDVFMLEVLDAMGNTPQFINAQESAKTLLASGNICATGVKKKLHWCLREKQRKRTMTMVAEQDDATKKQCNVCCKNIGGLFSSSGTLCQLCRKRTCSKCTITKHLILSVTEKTTEAKAFDCCRICFIDVKNLSTVAIARAELQDRQERRKERSQSTARARSDTGTSSATSKS